MFSCYNAANACRFVAARRQKRLVETAMSNNSSFVLQDVEKLAERIAYIEPANASGLGSWPILNGDASLQPAREHSNQSYASL